MMMCFLADCLEKALQLFLLEEKYLLPFSGEIITLLDSKHAIGLKGDNGVELLIHVGIDTVTLKDNILNHMSVKEIE